MAKRVGVDKWMFGTVLVLVVVGLVMVFSASAVMAETRYHSPYGFVLRQMGWAGLGLLAMLLLIDSWLAAWCLVPLWGVLHLPAVGDCEAGARAVSGVVFAGQGAAD